jgi:hypothetical protein
MPSFMHTKHGYRLPWLLFIFLFFLINQIDSVFSQRGERLLSSFSFEILGFLSSCDVFLFKSLGYGCYASASRIPLSTSKQIKSPAEEGSKEGNTTPRR